MSEPLILLPGFMSDIRIWGPQIETLSLDHNLYLPTWGEAASIEACAEAVLEHAPERFALAGMSFGAMVAMEVLRRAPKRVSRVCFIATHCLAETPPGAAERELRIARAKAGRLQSVLAEEMPESILADGPLRAPLAEFLQEMALGMGSEAYLRQARALQRRPDQQKTLRQARLPALILCGAEDRLYLPRRHEFMAGLMPKAQLKVIEGAGHAVTLEQPEAVTRALSDWMARSQEPLLLK